MPGQRLRARCARCKRLRFIQGETQEGFVTYPAWYGKGAGSGVICVYCATLLAQATPEAIAAEAQRAKEEAEREAQAAPRIAREQALERAKMGALAGLDAGADVIDAAKADAYEMGRFAALPEEGSGIATLLRVAQEERPNPRDTFTQHDSLVGFLSSLEEPLDTPARELARRWLLAGPYDKFNSAKGCVWEGFTRDMSFEELKRFWYGGWPEGVEKMRAALDRVEVPETRDIRRRGRWSDVGEDLSTDKLYSGAWDNAWRTSRRRAVIAPVRVRIVVEIGSECGACGRIAHDAEIQPADALFWKGAAACALSESLEAAGYGVEVVLVAASTRIPDGRTGAGTIGLAVTAKAFDGPLDVALMAATSASPSLFRRGYLLHSLRAYPAFDRLGGGRAPAPYYHGNFYGYLLRVETAPRVRAELRLDEEGVATVFVSDWVLSAPLANAWARATHGGLESVNNPERSPFGEDEEG